MLIEIRVPLREASGSAYEKVDRRVGDWAVAAAGASLTVTDGMISTAGVALAAVGSKVTSLEAEEMLAGQPPSEELFAGAAAAAAAGVPARQRPAGLGGIQTARRRRVDRARIAARGNSGVTGTDAISRNTGGVSWLS